VSVHNGRERESECGAGDGGDGGKLSAFPAFTLIMRSSRDGGANYRFVYPRSRISVIILLI